jgi:hypothetical protein
VRDRDEVFFFTLVDLFIQVMFFGLLLFVMHQAIKRKELPDGISNITELTDSLIALTSAANHGNALRDSVEMLGGIAFLRNLSDSTEALTKRVKIQYGLPPCRGLERFVGTAVVNDEQIEFTEITPALDSLIRQVLGRTSASVRLLKPDEFQVAFKPLTVAYPNCRYFVRVRRQNRLEAPILALHSAFRTELRKAPQ